MSIPRHIIKTDNIWFKDVSQLYRIDRLAEFFPSLVQTQEERLNSLARLGIYSGLLLALYKRDYRQLAWILLALFITYFVYKNEEKKEKMTVEPSEKIKAQPTLNNPFMNPTILDFGIKPTKENVPTYYEDTKEAEEIRADIKDKFDYNLYKSIDDVYDKNNGQRQFYTVPNTDIPSNQERFLKFLYGDMQKNCKSTTETCEPYSDLRANPFIFPNPKENPTVTGNSN